MKLHWSVKMRTMEINEVDSIYVGLDINGPELYRDVKC